MMHNVVRTVQMVKLSHSASAIKLFETCPKQYYHKRITKDVKDVTNEAAELGKQIHKHFEDRLISQTPLPSSLAAHEPICRTISAGKGKLMVEKQLTLNADFEPTEWFADNAWLRSCADVIVLNDRVATVLDWKTGKRQADATQLCLLALQIFAHYKEVQTVKSAFVWLKTSKMDSSLYKRENILPLWSDIMSRIGIIQDALNEDAWIATPSGLCSYCPVTSNLCKHSRRS